MVRIASDERESTLDSRPRVTVVAARQAFEARGLGGRHHEYGLDPDAVNGGLRTNCGRE
jgi:hypothetical protein